MGDEAKIHIGNLSADATREELEEKFGKFGAVKSAWYVSLLLRYIVRLCMYACMYAIMCF